MFKLSFPNTEVSRVLKGPCNTIWELLTDTERWPQWGPSVRAVECADRFIRKGSSGKVQTAAGIWMPFLITEFEKGRHWSWNVSAIPATGHRIEPQGNGECRVTFEVPLLAAPYAYICKIALDRIERIIEGEHT